MKTGNYLKLKRIEKKLSLRQMSYKTGLSHTYISDIEKRKVRGTLITQEKILNALQLNSEEKKIFYKDVVLEKLPLNIRCNMEQMEHEINY
ncbi:helix-turn-helix domain-containing protein [Cetobacterium somerae]